MVFRIGFTGALAPDGARLGEITLGEVVETFASDTRRFRPDRYERQWRQALEMALVQREVAALFSSVAVDEEGVGALWLYPVIPSELAQVPQASRARQTGYPERDDGGSILPSVFCM